MKYLSYLTVMSAVAVLAMACSDKNSSQGNQATTPVTKDVVAQAPQNAAPERVFVHVANGSVEYGFADKNGTPTQWLPVEGSHVINKDHGYPKDSQNQNFYFVQDPSTFKESNGKLDEKNVFDGRHHHQYYGYYNYPYYAPYYHYYPYYYSYPYYGYSYLPSYYNNYGYYYYQPCGYYPSYYTYCRWW